MKENVDNLQQINYIPFRYMEYSDLKPNMKFLARGEGKNLYTLIMIDRGSQAGDPRNGQIKLKRAKDGLVLTYNTGRFLEILNNRDLRPWEEVTVIEADQKGKIEGRKDS